MNFVADFIDNKIYTTRELNLLGMLLCYVKGLVWHWRIVSWSANAYIILLVALLILIPESPPWLVSKGRIREALKSLEWFNKYQPITSDCVSIQWLDEGRVKYFPKIIFILKYLFCFKRNITQINFHYLMGYQI